MDEQEYRIKAKMNEYHQQALEKKAVASKLPFCKEILRADIQRTYIRRERLKPANVVAGGLLSAAAVGSLRSLAVLPIAFVVGYTLADLAGQARPSSGDK